MIHPNACQRNSALKRPRVTGGLRHARREELDGSLVAGRAGVSVTDAWGWPYLGVDEQGYRRSR